MVTPPSHGGCKMATFRKRNDLWQVQVRNRKIGSVSKSFHKKIDAQNWAKEQEVLMQSGEWSKTQTSNYTLKDLLTKYKNKITPSKKGSKVENRKLRRLLTEKDLMKIPLERLHPPILAAFRDRRLKDGVRACQYDLVLIRHAWNIACIEWGWDLGDNPVEKIRLPKNNPPRERRLKPGEYEKLKKAFSKTKVWYLWPIIDFAIETGMRRSEILGMKWEHIGIDNQRVLLPLTKNGSSRWVPLSDKAIKVLDQIPRTTDHVFPITDVALRQSWERLRNRANLIDFTFHDLRHEAISRMFEKGLNVPEVASISGHKTASQLFRYVQVNARL